MRGLVDVCIRRPVFAAMLIVSMVVVGGWAFTRLGVDRLPSVDFPTVSVRTVLPGASPEEVETQVSQVLEEVINTIEGIEELRSISGPGQSIVLVTFSLDREIEAAAQDVRDRVAAAARRLPADAEPPVVSKFDNDSSPVLTLALSGPISIPELTEIADKLVKRELERSRGVGEVAIVGGVERTVNVWVDAERLASYRLPITAVRDALVRQNSDIPGGNVTGERREQVLRTMGRLSRAEAFNDITIARVDGTPVMIRDVGWAEDGSREVRTAARLDGEPAVSIEVRRQSGANTIAVIERVKANLDAVRAQLPEGVRVEVIRDQSRYIYAALHEIEVHLVLGAILASLVVLAFMRSWRATVIAAVAIPTSVVSTLAVMWAMGFTLNSVTMLALVLMVGIVIDDAIVVLENIYRFVEEKGVPPLEAARQGTREIALAVLATTLSLVVIFVPVSFMSSISGRFLFQFGVTASAAVMVSLLVSFTLTPMMSARMLGAGRTGAGGHGTPASRRGFYRIIDVSYTWMLRGAMRARWLTAIVAVAVMASAVPLYGLLPQDYMPRDVDEAEFSVNIIGPEGVSFGAFDEAVRAVEADVRAHPAVRTTLVSTGGSFLGQVNRGDIYVRIAPHAERTVSPGRLWRALLAGRPLDAFRGNYTQADVMNDLRRAVRAYRPDLRISVRPFAAFNIGGGNFDIDLAFRGPELERLAAYTETLRARAGELGGLPDLDTTLKLNNPELRVVIDRERASDLGVSPRDIGTALRLLVGGEDEVTRFRDPATSEDYDVQLRLAEGDRRDPTGLARLLVPGDEGVVELRSLASIEPAESAARIDRLDRQRAANVRGSVAGEFALADRLEAMRAIIDDMDLPPAYTVRVLGRGRELERTFQEFLAAFVLSLVFMYIILAANYESLIHPFTILLAIPLSIPFAFLSLYLLGGTLNLYSALGILVLFGVVKKNSILQVDHMNHLRAGGMPRAQAIIQANRDRLRPILMTTLALVGGMLPLAIGSGPGAEERRAVATVVIGGQALSLLVTLLVTPVVYSILDDLRSVVIRPRAAPAAAEPAGAQAR